MPTLSKTQVDLDGLLEVLGKNLYSNPHVAIRELIQNAHDACIRHQIETSAETSHQISVECETANNVLVISDNGSGLTFEEISQYLATIGSGYTRVLRSQTQTEDMIGYFGLGFLSAYVIAEKVEVITTSYQTPNQTHKFVSKGGQRFSVETVERRQRGSQIRLYLKDEFSQLANTTLMTRLLARYCALLPIKIVLDGGETPINNLTLPWNFDGPEVGKKRIQEALAKRFETQFAPLVCFDIKPNDMGLDGLIWIQDGRGYGTSDYRKANIFVRNMFITDDQRDFLPSWAGFAGCVINTAKLTPTASREAIQTDEHYDAVRLLINDSLIDGLQQLASNDIATWRRVLRRHNQSLLGAALCNDQLFEQLQNELKLPTSMGEKTIPAILGQTNNRLYVQEADAPGFQEVLFAAQKKPIIHGYLFAAAGFCHRYQQLNQHVRVQTLGDGEQTDIFKPALNDISNASTLHKLFSQTHERIEVCRFEPAYLPIVIVDNRQVQLKKKIENDEADKRMGSALLALARKTTAKISDDYHRTLYINSSNQLIQRLGSLPKTKQTLVAGMMRSFVSSIGDSSDAPVAVHLEQYFEQFNALLEQ